MDTTDAPSDKTPGFRNKRYISTASSSPIALVASSKRSSCGRFSTACAMAMRCCSPPESTSSQLATEERSRLASTLLRPTASIAWFASSSENVSSVSGYARACFREPCGIYERCGTKSVFSGSRTAPRAWGQMPPKALKKQLLPEPEGAVSSTNSPSLTAKPASFQTARSPEPGGNQMSMLLAKSVVPVDSAFVSGVKTTSVLFLRSPIAAWKLRRRSAVARNSVRLP
mmetsp:Transcript_149094/g.478867  ORF Transcript_149094/g.478867 Transcript_149094/m.478867 type:complete len:228 (+) Transcript_149094:256-939(+)